MAISPGSVLLIQVRGRLHGQRVMNNFYYYTIAGSSANIMTATVGAVEEWINQFENNYVGCMSNEVENLTVRGQILQPNGTPNPTRHMFYEMAMPASTGAVNEDALPSTTTVVVRRRTDLSGRRYRGRIYLPGVPKVWETDSVLTEAALGIIGVWAVPMLTLGFVAALTTWGPCVTNPPIFSRLTPVTAAIVDPVLRVQRRREVGVGE